MLQKKNNNSLIHQKELLKEKTKEKDNTNNVEKCSRCGSPNHFNLSCLYMKY